METIWYWKKIIPSFCDASETINKECAQYIQDDKNKINSFDELKEELESLRIDNKSLKGTKNNKLVNLCISIIYQHKYKWIKIWDKYDKEKIDSLDCKRLIKYHDAIYRYTEQEYEIFFELWLKSNNK